MNAKSVDIAVKRFMVLMLFAALSLAMKGQSKLFPSTIIEDFESGQVVLTSWSGEDQEPDAWELNAENTWNNSQWSLKIYGNTWKTQEIVPVPLDSNSVWQVSAFIESVAEIQGFGISDGENKLYYAFSGTQEINPNTWIPVYQGCFQVNQWNIYQLPVGNDWLSFFGYLPEISKLVYINDKDNTSTGACYIDQILNISNDLPIAPVVSVSFSRNGFYHGEDTEIHFQCEIIDPDSEEHIFYWDFGDGSTSNDQNPIHVYQAGDDHPYTVLLRVTDDTGLYGLASCKVNLPPGLSSLPVKLNFVGDIMLARKYEYPGGIIPTLGVEAIFAPTLPFLGDAADITIANLECPFTTQWEHHPTKPIYFKGLPANLEGLVFAGIDIVSLANNHILDYREAGMLETFSNLELYNIKYSGAGSGSYEAYRPEFYAESGLCFVFLAASDRTGQYNNYQPFLNAGYNKPGFANLERHYISRQIEEVRDVADFVIMEWHSGGEYSTQPEDRFFTKGHSDIQEEDYYPLNINPTDESREIRQFAIDHGADLVVCHHPHIMQGVEIHNGKLIAHSLGNFVFDLDYPETFPTFILNADAGINGFDNYTLIPVYIDDYIPKRAIGELGLYILNDLAQSSAQLNTWLKIDEDEVKATVIIDSMSVTQAVTTHENTLTMQESTNGYISPPLRIEKEGNLSAVNFIKPSGNHEFRAGREIIWFGNMEDEGCTLWDLNNDDESFCDTTSAGGLRSLRHRRTDASPLNLISNLENRIICRSDSAEYTLCGNIKTLNSGNVTIEIRYYSDRTGSSLLGEENIDTIVNGNLTWTFFYNNLTIPNGTRFFDIRLNSGVPQSGEGFSWFDDVRLICWEPWAKYDISETIPIPNDYFYLQVRSNDNHQFLDLNYSETTFDDIVVKIEETRLKNKAWGKLEQNRPNPFNLRKENTVFKYVINSESEIEITVHNLSGRLIRVLCQGKHLPGNYQVCWNGRDQSGIPARTGIYLISLTSDYGIITTKCILLDH